MSPKETPEQELVDRLDIVISLLLEAPMADTKSSMTDKIVRLADIGVPQTQIARIVRKPLNYVTASLY